MSSNNTKQEKLVALLMLQKHVANPEHGIIGVIPVFQNMDAAKTFADGKSLEFLLLEDTANKASSCA